MALAALVGFLLGCVPSGRPPFLQVQLCVGDEQGLLAFTKLMREIARSEKMNFVDGSEHTQRIFEMWHENDPRYSYTKPVVYLGIERDDMMGLEAGNNGLSSYQIAIGFNVGDSKAGAREFAQRVVEALRKRWQVQIIPEGKGAMPMGNCSSKNHGGAPK